MPWLNMTSLTLSDVKKLVPLSLLRQIRDINLCGNYGDPIMCKDLYDIVNYLSIFNAGISINTNGGAQTVEFWKQMGELSSRRPKLHVIFGIDGLEDTNHLYRINVVWDKLINNVTSYINAGGHAEWDYLVFDYNDHQIEKARELAMTLGFEKFTPAPPHGFKYNGKIRVVDKNGKFVRLIGQAAGYALNYSSTRFDSITFDNTEDVIKNKFDNLRNAARNMPELLSINDHMEIKNCTAKDKKEIYIDASGGIHPCCWIGHISQEPLEVIELVYHKDWIERTIGLENINGLNKPIKEIMESYFHLIEESWTKTFAQGRNPYCAFKCGLQRPSGMIRQ